MFNPADIDRNFGRAANCYDEHAELQRLVREECISMVQGFWKASSRILDLGCGTGALARENADWNIIQLDRAFGMCQAAKAHSYATVQAGADALPFTDQSFDGVFSSLMLQWVYDPLPTMKEIARVTKQGSVCILATLVRGTLQELRDAFATLDDVLHVNYFADPAPLTALCVHGGFKLLACEEETFTIHYPDVTALMRSIKAIGASTTQGTKRKGLMTPRQLKLLDQAYHTKFAKKKALPATWQVLYMLLERT